MRRLTQTITEIPGGDCLRTCIACLLDRDKPEDVPHFVGEEPYNEWLGRLIAWLAQDANLGVAMADFDSLDSALPGYCMLGVRTDNPRNPKPDVWLHCVVGHCDIGPDGPRIDIVHDPLPPELQNPILEIVDVLWIVRNAVS